MINQQEWIPVNVTMPPAGKWVLVCADGAMNCMWWTGQKWEDILITQNHNIIIPNISHWMHLPASPNDKNQGA